MIRLADASALACVVALGALAGAVEASAKSPPEITAELEQSRGVKVLRLEETSVDGRAAYIVSIMNAGGNSNAAFQVERIIVDAETGQPIPSYRHGPTGWSGTTGPEFNPPSESSGQAIRRMTFGTP